jgi:hypothetical protein
MATMTGALSVAGVVDSHGARRTSPRTTPRQWCRSVLVVSDREVMFGRVVVHSSTVSQSALNGGGQLPG